MRSPTTLFALSATLLVLGASCADKEEVEPAQSLANDLASAPIQIDATSATPIAPLPSAPLMGTHLDGDGVGYSPAGQPERAMPSRNKKKAIELMLRSTPPGAIASIDGKPIGNTPTFWSGAADGRPHEYTFTKKGYAMARYRFVSTQSGVVHGSLKALVESVEEAPPTTK